MLADPDHDRKFADEEIGHLSNSSREKLNGELDEEEELLIDDDSDSEDEPVRP
jgi:hypothetical protein